MDKHPQSVSVFGLFSYTLSLHGFLTRPKVNSKMGLSGKCLCGWKPHLWCPIDIAYHGKRPKADRDAELPM